MSDDDNVIQLDTSTRLDIPVERVLSAAKDCNGVVIIGWDEDDNFYFASSIANGADILWLMELAKKELLKCGDE